MAKKFTFRGYELEELQKMDFNEFVQLLDSRSRRKIKRGYKEVEKKFVEKVNEGGNFIKTHVRDVIVTPDMVGKKIAIHNGKEFVPVEIKPEMIGHRLGEFALTRKLSKHSAPGVGATRSSKFVPLK